MVSMVGEVQLMVAPVTSSRLHQLELMVTMKHNGTFHGINHLRVVLQDFATSRSDINFGDLENWALRD